MTEPFSFASDCIGIDEAGRGAWAGPMSVAAVRLHRPVVGLDDSKALTASRREALLERVLRCGTVSVGWVSCREIDELGLTEASGLAARRALAWQPASHPVLIDGVVAFVREERVRTLARGDRQIAAIMAASIAAKVFRDRYMERLDRLDGRYGFAAHKGYGTRSHAEALGGHGVSPNHRTSYAPIKAFIDGAGSGR